MHVGGKENITWILKFQGNFFYMFYDVFALLVYYLSEGFKAHL